MIRIYRLLNVLSLDIVAGAMISALFFAKILQVEILPYGLAALALTVWIIYTADHLLDASKIEGNAATERHKFHQVYFRQLLIGLCIAIAAVAALVFFMRRPVIVNGFFLALMVGIYLYVQRYLRAFKEVLIACMYTCGVLLPSLAVTKIELTGFHVGLITLFVITALLNLWIFSWFDAETDRAHHQHSIATILGRGLTSVCIYVAGIVASLAGLYFLYLGNGDHQAMLSLVVMNILLLLVFSASTSRHDAFRLLGDAVFFVPAFYLLWAY